MDTIDFDTWAQLYIDDPVLFEIKKKELIDSVIMSAPVELRNKLRMLQIECNAITKLHSDPLEAAEKLTQLSVEKLKELKLPMTQLRAILEDL